MINKFAVRISYGWLLILQGLVSVNAHSEVTSQYTSIEVCTLAMLPEGSQGTFSDADRNSGDACDQFPQSIPVGTEGAGDGSYKLLIKNTGDEKLINVLIHAPDFDLYNVPVSSRCGSLMPLETCEIGIDYNNLAYLELHVTDVCELAGEVTKVASVSARGHQSGVVVSDTDSAQIQCAGEAEANDVHDQYSLMSADTY